MDGEVENKIGWWFTPELECLMSGGGGKLPQLCDACSKMAAKFKCSRCLRVCYCSKQCQEKHWRLHKKLCKTTTEEQSKALLSYSRPQEDKNMDLFDACLDGDLPKVKALIAEGADVKWVQPETRHTPLHAASEQGHLSVVNALIEARTVVDRVDGLGWTALMTAAGEGHEAIVVALHQLAGASVHHVNNEGRTALHMAAQNGHVGIVRYLLRAGANPNVVTTDGFGMSPIIIACALGHPSVVQALIEEGANVNHSRPDGATSLMIAVQLGHIEIVRALLAANADPHIAANDGTTALDIAMKRNYPAIVSLIEARLNELAAAGSA